MCGKRKLVKPESERIMEPIFQGAPCAIIIDLDGTICLNTSGRPYYGEGAAEEIWKDENLYKTTSFIYNYCCLPNISVIIVTGRPGTTEIKQATLKWLENNNVEFNEIYFRDPKDYRKSDVVKSEIYTKYIRGRYNVDFVLEDSNRAAEAYRKLGLLCFQVWNAD